MGITHRSLACTSAEREWCTSRDERHRAPLPGVMSSATYEVMRRLCPPRVVSSLISSTVQRRRATDVYALGSFSQRRNNHEVTTIPASYQDISTESNKAVGKDTGLKKRQYQLAPKRQHGRHAGWKKWSVWKNYGEIKYPVETGPRPTKELREVSTKLQKIRVSPWNLNLLTPVVRGLPVVDAIAQMEFSKKKHSVTVQRLIRVSCSISRGCIREASLQFSVGSSHLQRRLVISFSLNDPMIHDLRCASFIQDI